MPSWQGLGRQALAHLRELRKALLEEVIGALCGRKLHLRPRDAFISRGVGLAIQVFLPLAQLTYYWWMRFSLLMQVGP